MLGRKRLQHYGLGMKQGVHQFSKAGAKTLQYASPFIGLAQQELGVASEIGAVGLKGLERMTKSN